MSRGTTYYTWERDEADYEFRIDGTASKYYPATHDSPEEGGCVEDFDIRLMEVTYDDEEEQTERRHTALSELKRNEIELAFEGWLEADENKATRQSIEDEILQDASEP